MSRTRSATFEQHRDAIRAQAARLFARHGYPVTPIAELARSCGISKALLYHYYRDKEQLLFDIADRYLDSLLSIVAEVEATLGGVDILVNNAAIRPNQKISEITVEDWDRVFATNLRAPFFLSQAVLSGMVKRRWGRIINIGGTDAYLSKPRRAHGVSAKLGIVGLSRALAVEVARFGVTVNTVVPGTIDTVRPHPEWYPGYETGFAERKERIPMVRLGAPQEVADACLFLASNLAGYTTATELFVNGGAFPLVRQPLEEYEAEDF